MSRSWSAAAAVANSRRNNFLATQPAPLDLANGPCSPAKSALLCNPPSAAAGGAGKELCCTHTSSFSFPPKDEEEEEEEDEEELR
mmetsp:Transcript_19629/g.38891  ORF Transcript_19629/g.38891 Transcript_19629/m.38891 type:complete len:85 (-) Transcript_19629:132-386(-)|eukprot:CAMPEP_0175123126 /NCGR_PEP_ID=MMETSP0087-20121206/2077_1 /TAXON_ID=136419 /ORGANISM="Unknown Unknown, Strain D1" /LENGTH=84 /DNA_ID=CAMNT_0016404797 /DNA_START=212 /DNA_END=466 /DNA_ORIENTATION=+